MGPGLADALVITVAYPQASRLSSSRVLKIPLSSLSDMMNVLHQQGAVVTHVGPTVAEAEPGERRAQGADAPPPPRKRGSNRKTKEHL